MEKYLYGIKYENKTLENSILVKDLIPNETETFTSYTKKELELQTYSKLSERNPANLYIIPSNEQTVWLNFIAQKTHVPDDGISKFVDRSFTFFTEEITSEPEKFILADGEIFRCAGETLKPLEQYTYYIMKGGKSVQIPNFKTLEVMLAERNLTINSIRILEENKCSEIEKDLQIAIDKTSQWSTDIQDMTNLAVYKKLSDNAKSAGAMMEEATKSADKQIQTVKDMAAADKAKAEASKKEAEAAKSASEAAIATAKAAEASANAAKAEAEQAKAEAEAQKAQLEANKPGN
jgi:hypothetical protein